MNPPMRLHRGIFLRIRADFSEYRSMAERAADRYNNLTVNTENKEVMRMDSIIPLYGFGGGGGTGATLTVNAPTGAAVTVAKSGKTKSKTAVGGKAVFRGLESGTWTITITDGTRTAAQTVEIQADYQAEIAFFSAVMEITYPAGLTCTAVCGTTRLTAPDTSGSWTCAVDSPGTWTVTAGQWSAEAALTVSGGTETVRLARWIVRKGVLTDVGLSNLLISGRTLTPAQETGYLQIHNTLSNQAAGILSGESFDLADAAKVTADLEVLTTGANSSAAKFSGIGLVLTQAPGYSNLSNASSGIAHEDISKSTGRLTLTVDTSGITGQWYVGFAMGAAGNIKVYNLCLEV